MFAWYATPRAPTESADVGDARATRSAVPTASRRAAGSWEKTGSDGSRERYRDSRIGRYATTVTPATSSRVSADDLPRHATIPPQHDARDSIVRRTDMHAARYEIGRAVAVEIRGRQRDEMRWGMGDRVHRELLAAVVLEPNQAERRRIGPRVVSADDRHVEIAVLVCIERHRTRRAREIGDAMEGKFVRAEVLEPLHAVPRPAVGGRIVERVAVAVQQIDVAVAVE